MANLHKPEHEKKRKKERELEREVLLHLRSLNASVNWETLYVHFDRDRTGSIGPVLQVLKDGRYIAADEKNNVAITKLGLKRLEAAMF
jgi:hypothetical protein